MRYSEPRKGTYTILTYGCKCGETNPSNFYGAKKTECKGCFNKRSVEYRRSLKLKGIERLGGKCQSCGYNKYVGALEFHHKDAAEKDITIAGRGLKWDTIKHEIDKCILLCANCHREEHNRLRLTCE